MITDKLIYFFFTYINCIKRFNTVVIAKYSLSDIPYNLAGKTFPKIGEVVIENELVLYRFHGRGMTLFWNDIEIFSNVDATSKHKIIITLGGWHKYLLTFFKKEFLDSAEEQDMLEKSDDILYNFERIGILMTRKAQDLGTFHVNEVWYECYVNKIPFLGQGKDQIDWI